MPTGTNFSDGQIRLGGTVDHYFTNDAGHWIFARCTVANIPTGAGYAIGCLLQATDTGNNYVNTGNTTTASFTLLDAGASFSLPIAATDSSTTTGTSANFTMNTVTSGKGLLITVNGLTTGFGASIAHTTAVIASGGSLLNLSSTSIDTATTTGALLNLSSTASLAAVQFLGTYSGLTTGVGQKIVANALTTGFALSIPHTTSVISGGGSLLNISSSSVDTTTTSGSLATFTNTGGTASTLVLLSDTALLTGIGLSVSHTTGVLASGGSLVRIASTSVDTGTTNGVLLDLSSTASAVGTQVLGTFSALTTGIGISAVANVITTGNIISATSTSAAYTSSNLLNVNLTSSSATLATATGALANFSYSLTGTATSGTVSPTNNALAITATMIQNGAGGTLAPSGAVVSITLVSTQTAGTLTDSRVGLSITTPSGVTGAPLSITQSNVTSTHFKKVAVFAGTTLWISDGNTPNAALSGTAGDICWNADSGKQYHCTGTTSWTVS